MTWIQKPACTQRSKAQQTENLLKKTNIIISSLDPHGHKFVECTNFLSVDNTASGQEEPIIPCTAETLLFFNVKQTSSFQFNCCKPLTQCTSTWPFFFFIITELGIITILDCGDKVPCCIHVKWGRSFPSFSVNRKCPVPSSSGQFTLDPEWVPQKMRKHVTNIIRHLQKAKIVCIDRMLAHYQKDIIWKICNIYLRCLHTKVRNWRYQDYIVG